MKMAGKLAAGLTLLVLAVMLLSATVWAANSASVSATVTPQNISIEIIAPTPPVTLTYGVLAFGDVDKPPSPDSYIQVRNSGNVPETFSINGANMTVSGVPAQTWTISDTSTGSNVYMHKTTTSASSGSGYGGLLPLHGADLKTFDVGVSATADRFFKMRLSMPAPGSSADSPVSRSTSVTVTATAS